MHGHFIGKDAVWNYDRHMWVDIDKAQLAAAHNIVKSSPFISPFLLRQSGYEMFVRKRNPDFCLADRLLAETQETSCQCTSLHKNGTNYERENKGCKRYA